MLHIVVMTHSPESCPSHPHIREQFTDCFTKLDQIVPEREMKIVGNWIDPPAHTNFVLVEAVSAHAVLLERAMSTRVQAIERAPQAASHAVYFAKLTDGRNVVIRIAVRAESQLSAGAVDT
jgi:hypothetical protein